MSKPVVTEQDSSLHEDAAGVPRRAFLKATAAGVGAALLSSCGGGGPDAPAPVPLPGEEAAAPFGKFDSLVVLMFENRSFDNLLGYLYPSGSKFEGLSGKSLANPVPAKVESPPSPPNPSGMVLASPNTGTYDLPNPNPGEGYAATNTQLFGIIGTPYNQPAPNQVPTMQGFVVDYCDNYFAVNKKLPTYKEYSGIMSSYGPDPAQPTQFMMPVIATLASKFAVYDHWFAAVPSETYCNRSFFHASTSNGQVENSGTGDDAKIKWRENDWETIFEALEAALPKRSWSVYSDFFPSLTLIIHFPRLKNFQSHFRTMADFYADAYAGSLPDYAFIEPWMSGLPAPDVPPQSVGTPVKYVVPSPGPGNSMHPNQNVLHGELLLNNVYNAVRTGKNATRTTLLVTFDEHGGCYDHVVPGPTNPPGTKDTIKPDSPFGFDRLGLRVPTIAISAYTRENTVVNDVVNHAAVIRTLRAKFGIGKPLTARDADGPLDAGDLQHVFNINDGTFRAPSTWPEITPVAPPAYVAPPDSTLLLVPPYPEKGNHRDWIDYVDLAYRYLSPGKPAAWPLNPTLGDARQLLVDLEAKWRSAVL
jgi:phospholipase C